jgi:hypothetical protein
MINISNNLQTKNPKICNFCGKQKTLQETLKKCGRCKKIFYCGVTCQRKDWKTHKKICKEPDNETTKKTSNLAKKNICQYCEKEEKNKKFQKCFRCLETKYCSKTCQINDWKDHKKNCKFKFDPTKWLPYCLQSKTHLLIDNLKGKENSLFMGKIAKNPKHSNLFMACLGMLLDALEQRLFGKVERRSHTKRYYQYLEEKNYIKMHTLKSNENEEFEYKKGMKSGVIIDYHSPSKSRCNLTSKGKKYLKEIQQIALNIALEMHFLSLIQQKNISFNEILNNEHFETLFKYRKLFLLNKIIFTLLKSKDEEKYEKFINELEKAFPKNVRIQIISENKLNEISEKISLDQIVFKKNILKETFLLKTFSVENITKKDLIALLRNYELI